MGYKVKRKGFCLKFAEGEYEGMEVICRSISIGQLLEFDTTDSKGQRMVQLFGEALISWNLEEEDGTPIPATPEGLSTLEPGIVRVIVEAWSDQIAGVNRPLLEGSSSGETSLAQSIPMEPLSTSQAS
jgi:hypothetical protein